MLKLIRMNLKNQNRPLKLVFQLTLYFTFSSATAQSNDWVLTDKAVFVVDIEIDNNGNLITLCSFDKAYGQVDVDPGSGEFILESNNLIKPQFLRKIDANGEFVWAILLDSYFEKMELDEANNIYLMNSFQREFDANPTSGALLFNADPLNENNNYSNIALTKLDAQGSFLWAKHVTQGGDSYLSSFDVLKSGDICIIGTFKDNVDVDASASEYIISSPFNLYYNSFLLRLDTAGNFKWVASQFGQQEESGIKVKSLIEDFLGNIYISGGYFGEIEFDSTLAGPEIIETPLDAHFIAKYDSLGNFIWAKENGELYYSSFNIQLYDSDQYGNVYVAGDFTNTRDFGPGTSTYNVTSMGGADIFIQKIDSLGNLVWLKQFGGVAGDFLVGLAVDAGGNIYHYGVFEGEADLDPGPGIISLTAYGNGFYEELIIGGPSLPDKTELVPAADTYVQKINNSGSVEWTGQIGGKEDDKPNSIQLDNNGNIILTGLYYGAVDFRPGPDSLIAEQTGLYYHPIIAKLTQPLEGLTPIYVPEQPTFYPNPASSFIFFDTGLLYETYATKLISTNGDVVFQNCCVTEKSAIDIVQLPAGVYILYLYNEQKSHTFKVIVAR